MICSYIVVVECTSAVSSDVEGRMYEHAKSIGITLITISLRSVLAPLSPHFQSLSVHSNNKYSCSYSPSLAKYHTQLLTLSGDGTGSWTLTRVGTAEVKMGIDREIGLLRERLKEVEQWEKRVKELEVMLGPEGAET